MSQTENVKNSKNSPPPQATPLPKINGVDTSGFVQDDIALPPYWNPQEGESIYAQPVSLDATDPTFIRFVLEAKSDIICKRGPSDDAENVPVKTGERFTMSVYAGLQKPFFMYMVAGIPALITCKSKRKLAPSAKNPTPRTFWNFESRMMPEHKNLLDSKRKEFEAKALEQIQLKQQLLEAATEQAETK